MPDLYDYRMLIDRKYLSVVAESHKVEGGYMVLERDGEEVGKIHPATPWVRTKLQSAGQPATKAV